MADTALLLMVICFIAGTVGMIIGKLFGL